MKPLIQKLPLSEDSSFVARTYKTPNFEVPWHQHLFIDKNLTIIDICYESGFSTLANFNKQFLKIKGFTPSHFRNHFRESIK